jgi:hypothetical protein
MASHPVRAQGKEQGVTQKGYQPSEQYAGDVLILTAGVYDPQTCGTTTDNQWQKPDGNRKQEADASTQDGEHRQLLWHVTAGGT